MSTKDATILGKPLKGGKGANEETDLDDLLALLTGGTLSGLTLEDVTIFTGDLNDVTIGGVVPSDGFFRNLQVGIAGEGGNFIVLGSNADNNNVPIDYMEWDKTDGILNIFGGLTVRDPATFGNIVIRDNDIVAINDDGEINLIPNSSNAAVFVAGNMRQSVAGDFQWKLATDFCVLTDNLDTVSKNNARFGSRNGDTTISADVFKDPSNITSMIYDVGGSIVNTDVPHNLEVGQTINITGTAVDGTYTVSEVLSDQIFKTVIPTIFTTETSGVVSPVRDGTLNLFAGSQVRFRENTPIYLNETSNKPSIVGSGNNITITGDYICLVDPIISLKTESGAFSDSGVAVSYKDGLVDKTGFFGFRNATNNFTWIPDATITETATGKEVTGTKGIMELQGLLVSILGGDPDLLIDVPLGDITINTNSTTFPDSSPINIGTTGTITSNATNTIFDSTGNFLFNADICIPEGVKIKFSSNTEQTITGSPTGIQITSEFINLNGILNLTEGLQFGVPGNTIYPDGNNLHIEAVDNLILNPGVKLHLPENVFFQIGDTVGTGIYGANGAIFQHTITDTNISADRYINLTSNAGQIYINTLQTFFSSNSELVWGNGHSISTLPTTLPSESPRETISINATDVFAVNANEIRLNSPKIKIPNDTLLCFGDQGSEMHFDSSSNTLHLNSTNYQVDGSVVVNGALVVNGPSSIITSNVTVFDDPVIRLGGEAPPLDIKSRGFDFVWFDNSVEKVGFLGLNQQQKRFILSLNGTTANDIHTPTELGDLLLNKLFSAEIETDTFVVSLIQGNPDLTLQAFDLYLSPTNAIHIPVGIMTESGQTSVGATSNDTYTLEAPNISIPSGNLLIGDTELVMTDLNNFHIRNVQNIHLEATVNIGTALTFGQTGVSISVDNQNNIVFTSASGGDTIFSGTAVLDGGMDMGNAVMEWSSTNRPGGEVVWRNTLPNTDLNVCLDGNFVCGNWQGDPITIEYGGTGHVGAWHARSIVFVSDSETYLDEDPDDFIYNHTLKTMGIRTNDPNSTITIGSGDIEFLANQDCILWNHDGFLRYAVGKVGRHFHIMGTPLAGITDKAVLGPLVTVNKYGQVGIGISTPFMDALQGLPDEGKLYISGHIMMSDPSYGIYFSETEYIDGANNTLSFYSQNTITYNADVLFGQNAYFFDTSNVIYGEAGGILNIESNTLLELNSPIVNVENCLCLHYNSFTSQCEMYLKRNDLNNELEIINLIGDILLSPLSNIRIPDNKNILMGSNGTISVTPSEMRFAVNTGDVAFDANNINILDGSNLLFYAELPSTSNSRIYQNDTQLVIEGIHELFLNVPKVRLPVGSGICFGSDDNRITSTLNSLDIFGLDDVNFSSPDINILDGSLLNFYAPTLPNTFSSIYQTDTEFSIDSTFDVHINSPTIVLPTGTSVVFGNTTTRIGSSGNVLQLFGTDGIALEAPQIDINNGSKICFHAPTPSLQVSCIYQTATELVIEGNLELHLNTDSVVLPVGADIVLGDPTQRITSTANSIEIYSPDLIDIISNNVRITGNLVVDKKSTFTIEAETSFDSGIIELGGGQMIDITLLGSYAGSQTLVTLASVHSLVPGDTVTIFDSIPNIGGDYVIASTPTPTTFAINIPFPGIPAGADPPYGRIRSVLVQDPNNDIGVQLNWHLGTTGSTDYRYGFFGFRRSDQCFTFIPEANRIGDHYFGTPGNICVNQVNAPGGINTPILLGPLDAGNNQITGDNFIINGGAINNTPIGVVTPAEGHFTNLTADTLTLTNGACIPNLLCNMNTGVYQVLGSNFVINGGQINDTPIGNVTPSTGSFTDINANTIQLVTGICAPNLLCDLNTSTYQVTGSNFVITGGSIDGTPIGSTVPSTGYFTNIDTSTITVTDTTLVENLNADLLDGYHADFFITIDGQTQLIANWNAGNVTITANEFVSNGLTDTSLFGTGVVYAGPTGELMTENVFYYNDVSDTLFVPNITAAGSISAVGMISADTLDVTTICGTNLKIDTIDGFQLTGNIDGNNFGITNIDISNAVMTNSDIIASTIDGSNITNSNFTLGPSNTFNAIAGNVFFANDQISGNWIAGGTADIDISGNAATVTDGIYTTIFQNDHTIIKADVAGTPIELFVPEESVIGRIQGGVIDAISFTDLGNLLNITSVALPFVPNSILFADSTPSPINVQPLVVPFSHFVGRKATGEITVLNRLDALEILDIPPINEENIYNAGAILQTGHLNYPNGGTMTGLLFTSFERFSMLTGDTRALDTDVETSYIMVNYSQVGGRVATCTLGSGIADGHRKVIMVSSIANNAALRVNCTFTSIATVNPEAFIFLHAGQSVMLQWDTVMNSWFGINTGAIVVTTQDLQNPNWLACLDGSDDDINDAP